MTKLKIDWKELLFPVLEDIRIINNETDTAKVSSNNWSLAENNNTYKEILGKIKENQSEVDTQHNIIIIR